MLVGNLLLAKAKCGRPRTKDVIAKSILLLRCQVRCIINDEWEPESGMTNDRIIAPGPPTVSALGLCHMLLGLD